ncbi:winged helix-turn-helix domain-containing protein [Streptomyces griseoincarnatus]|uniref:Winged helix-turn-helix domain-containing protein n=1 Tax=Streptomyces griseoincarnatus TaxID=29305 RepID=A0ABT0VRJ0_STRGI|nr:BTAD domain-containing putative transcriptional regulator [Streptomyces griseoincarnatus]MCM2513957.1 winged helix-turn-helix domain-containing protein [Streptomyces griseoincarnatus]
MTQRHRALEYLSTHVPGPARVITCWSAERNGARRPVEVAMQFRVLGSPGIHDDVRRRSVRLTSPKQRVLLGALTVRLGTPVPTEELIRELWGDDAPDKAGNALQAHVSRLRQQLVEAEPSRVNTPRLVVRGPGYVLQARPEELDSVQFRLQVTRARRLLDTDPHTAALLLRKALGLWRGPALDGAGGPLCAAAAARLEDERLLALEDLCEASLRLGRHREVMRRLEELVAAHPSRPRFREQLTLALWRCGRHSEARAVDEAPRDPRPAEPVAPAHTGNVRVLRDAAGVRPGVREPAPGERPADRTGATEPPDHPGTRLELVRLRGRLEELTRQQHALRAEMERLMALMEEPTALPRRDSA